VCVLKKVGQVAVQQGYDESRYVVLKQPQENLAAFYKISFQSNKSPAFIDHVCKDVATG
jgi:hypothetical protein